jgi:hypothetical protein
MTLFLEFGSGIPSTTGIIVSSGDLESHSLGFPWLCFNSFKINV